MGQYRRKLKKGERWFYSGQYLNKKYFSKAIYLTKQEARKAEAGRIEELDKQARNPTKDIDLFNLMEERLDYLKLKKSLDYYKENRRYLKLAYRIWGNVPVSAISKDMVNKLVMSEAERLKKKGRDNFKVNSLIRCLKSFFNYGIKNHELDIKNPCQFVEFYSIDVRLKYIPTDEEITAVRGKLSHGQAFLFDFVDQSACRISEAIRFKAEDIDGNLITLWTRKSKNSNLTPRRIPKPDCLNGYSGKGRVFDNWDAYPRFLEEHTDKWNWHNLRHRRASIWANNGLTTFEIMVRLGHSNLSTTMKYLQLLGFTRL